MTWLALPLMLAGPPVTAVAFAPDGREIVVGSQAGLEVWTWPDWKQTRRLETKLDHVHDLAFSPDGRTVAAAGGTPAVRGSLELFRWPTGNRIRELHPHRDLIYAIAWQADATGIASASADGAAVLSSVAPDGGRVRFDGHSRGVLAVAFLPEGAGLVTGSIDATLRLWNIDKSKPMRTLSNHTLPVHALAVRPGESLGPPVIASVGDDRTVRFWQPTLGRLVRFVRLPSVPLAVAWLASGQDVVVSCRDGRVRVIDWETAEVVDDRPALDGPAYALAVAPDGSVLVGGRGGQLKRVEIKPTRLPR